jgi:outer membrane protein TolC
MRCRLLLWLALASIQGCSFYKAETLPNAPEFPLDVAAVGAPSLSPLTATLLPPHPFDASDGLDITEVATLAVLNNPDLRAARLALRVSKAQSFAAGLLPDPQINFSHDFPKITGPGISPAFLVGLSYSVNTLLAHSTVRAAGDSDDKQAELNLAWQEWQTIAQSRMLFVRLKGAEARDTLLTQTRAVLADRVDRMQRALTQGLLSLDAVTPHLAALQDIERQVSDLRRQTNQGRYELIALLGLGPDTVLVLQDSPALPLIESTAIDLELPALLAARPDIRALRAGYQAQDARYRAALLNQFPAFTFGVQRARDTSNAYTRGFSINLSLPLFNGGRGDIRVQDATRDKLRADYQQRLNSGSTDVHRLLSEQAISQHQLVGVERALQTLHSARDRMREALLAHNVDALALATLETATLAKETERIDALQALQEQRIALLTLTGNSGNLTP